ncbi:hypothetical protein EDM56_00805 [Brevibacillus fluminis]|uniref:DUF1330 domain-containing protein n=1 Tax=Brevibacillus fluminis TaxID=511487 RepID=A0A3M8DVR3_9BACL|nr:hypothetical protein [Brevibacillus fluminis]RNB92273.1 hypothetical protein EDM56_00805 [Brevibacillus fluminis]
MYTIFVEYRILPEKREAYFNYMSTIPAQISERGGVGYRHLEGVEQSNTFVEAFEVEQLETYQAIRSWRLSDTELPTFISGGAAKLHMWAFAPKE